MADVAWDFEAEAKFRRGFGVPTCYRFSRWDGVERCVALNGSEAPAV